MSADAIGTVRAEFADGECVAVYRKIDESEWHSDDEGAFAEADVADFPALWKPGMPVDIVDEVQRLRARPHDERCISQTDSEYNVHCDCRTWRAIDQHELVRLRAEREALHSNETRQRVADEVMLHAIYGGREGVVMSAHAREDHGYADALKAADAVLSVLTADRETDQ